MIFEFIEIILLLILTSASITQFDIIIQSSISHLDKFELSPILVFGPILVCESITQLLPIITGPIMVEFFLMMVPSPIITLPKTEAPSSFLPLKYGFIFFNTSAFA